MVLGDFSQKNTDRERNCHGHINPRDGACLFCLLVGLPLNQQADSGKTPKFTARQTEGTIFGGIYLFNHGWTRINADKKTVFTCVQ